MSTKHAESLLDELKRVKELIASIKHFQNKFGKQRGVEFVRSHMGNKTLKFLAKNGVNFPQDFL